MRRRAAIRLLPILALLAVSAVERSTEARSDAPIRLNDRAFWRLVSEFSEQGGAFRSDNFISNETTFQRVIPDLVQRTVPGGGYIGVGPDQNFTYVLALHPRIAFILDIRRQNMLLHLLYKAIIEVSVDRADFLSRWFSRPRPAGLTPSDSPRVLLDAFSRSVPSRLLFRANVDGAIARLTRHHAFQLSADDVRMIEYVANAFYSSGPDLRYSFSGLTPGRGAPTFGALMLETDERGVNHGYLASEEQFQALRAIQQSNLIVPVVGDFAGDKALRAIGRYLKDQGVMVTAFYTSNVEQYLFQSNAWRAFYSNVATLPIDARSAFVRSYFRFDARGSSNDFTVRSITLLDSMFSLVKDFQDDGIESYRDVIDRSLK